MPEHIAREYRRWWKTLTPIERRNLIASGTFRADAMLDELPGNNERMNRNPVDLHAMERKQSGEHKHNKVGENWTPINEDLTTTRDLVEQAEALADPKQQALELASLRLRATLHFLLEGLDRSTDHAVRLHADVIRLVVGEGCPPRMTELARRHGVTRAAVSLRCRKLLRRLGLEPSRFMRPQDEVNNMRIASILREKPVKKPDAIKKRAKKRRLTTPR